MELTGALIISIISVVITVSNFVLNRKDKAVNDTKDTVKTTTNQQLIEYRLTQVEKKLDKIIDILDNYEKEIDERVNNAIMNHIKLYHGGDLHGIER